MKPLYSNAIIATALVVVTSKTTQYADLLNYN